MKDTTIEGITTGGGDDEKDGENGKDGGDQDGDGGDGKNGNQKPQFGGGRGGGGGHFGWSFFSKFLFQY